MVTELFQMIYEHIWEFLLGLGLSTTVIYAMFRLIKGLIFVLFQKKKRQLAKKADNEALAELVAEKVVAKLESKFEELKASSDKIEGGVEDANNKLDNTKNEELDNLALDVKAYQSVMLAQDTSLRLQYEQVKGSLINASKALKPAIEDVTDTASQVADNVKDAIESNEDKLLETTEKVVETVKTVKNTAKKIKKKADDIVYD